MSVRSTAYTLAPEMAPEELASLTGLLRRCAYTGRHLEVGTAGGGTLCTMMKCYPRESVPPFVVVDPMGYFPNQLAAVQGHLASSGLDPAAVDFRVMTSDEAFRRASAASESYDFMLIDGAHKIRYVTQDLRWLSLLRVGGRACFHDYAPRCPGVMMPLDRFLARTKTCRRESLAGSLIVLERTAPAEEAEVRWMDHLWAQLWSPALQLQASVRKRLARRRSHA